MVVVFIIAILLAIAVPTYLGARERANDRAAQSNLRNANTNALVYYADGGQRFTANPAAMSALDPSLEYTNSLAATTSNRIYIELRIPGMYAADDTVYLGARTPNGRCFWIRTVGDKSDPRFARNDCSIRPADAAFSDDW